jgi:hypothetical protein
VKGTSPFGLPFVVFDKKSGTPGAGSSTMYVGVAATTAGTNLYRSKDAGATWTLVAGTTPPSALMPNHGVIASDGTMWIAYTNGAGPSNASSGSVWKLNTATDAWTNVNPAGHGGGIGGISVSTTDPNYAICTTIDWWNPDEIYRTTNGGTSWTGIGKSAQHNMLGAYYLCFGPPTCASPSSNGWDSDIQIDPFNQARAFHTTGQGVWCCTNADNATAGQVVWSFTDKNFEETVGMSLTSSVKKSLFACLGDIGIQRFPTDSLDTPSVHGIVANLGSGNGNYVDFAGLNPDIVIDCGAGGSGYSTDNGITWKAFASWVRAIPPITAQAGRPVREIRAAASHPTASIRKNSTRLQTARSTPAPTARQRLQPPQRGCPAAAARQRSPAWKGKCGWPREAICTTPRVPARAPPA